LITCLPVPRTRRPRPASSSSSAATVSAFGWNGTDAAPLGFPHSRGLAVRHVLDDANDPGYEGELAKLEKIAPSQIQWLRGFFAALSGKAA
jgi:hypothetical protein